MPAADIDGAGACTGAQTSTVSMLSQMSTKATPEVSFSDVDAPGTGEYAVTAVIDSDPHADEVRPGSVDGEMSGNELGVEETKSEERAFSPQ